MMLGGYVRGLYYNIYNLTFFCLFEGGTFFETLGLFLSFFFILLYIYILFYFFQEVKLYEV